MAADLELAVIGPDGRLLDEFTAFRLAFLEIHGFSPEDDPGGDDGWLQALVEKILGCPVEENEWGAVALLAWMDNLIALHKELKDDCRAASRLPVAKVSAGPDGSTMVTRAGRFVDVITFVDNEIAPVQLRLARPREHSPRRQRVRSSSSASRDGPDDSEPPLALSPARAGLEAVA